MSEVIKDHSRAIDLAARYGGDEFAVVLIDADLGMANRIAQRMKAALRDGREQPALGVSIGISGYPEDGRTAPELLEAADRSLYERKKAAHAQKRKHQLGLGREASGIAGQTGVKLTSVY